MSYNPPPIPGEQKQGMSGWAIAGIGCLVLVLVGFVGAVFAGKWLYDFGIEAMSKAGLSLEDFQNNPETAAAKLFVAASPDLELVGEDTAAGTMTVKYKSTGETVTVSYADLAQGKLVKTNSNGEEVIFNGQGADGQGSMVTKSSDGTTVMGNDASLVLPPAWVLTHPSAKPMSGGMRTETNDAIKGTMMAQSDTSVTELKDYYETELKAKGYTVQTNVTNSDTAQSAMISADSAAQKQKLVIMLSSEGGPSNIIVNYEGPK
jgi:hypothetical protein